MFVKRIFATGLLVAAIAGTGATALFASAANQYGKTFSVDVAGVREANLKAVGTTTTATVNGNTGASSSRWIEVYVSEKNVLTSTTTDSAYKNLQTSNGVIYYSAHIPRSYKTSDLLYTYSVITKPDVQNSFVIDTISYYNNQSN
ncbi:MAG: hypothetical protein QM689_12900 [Oscillospiraceae bacterium]